MEVDLPLANRSMSLRGDQDGWEDATQAPDYDNQPSPAASSSSSSSSSSILVNSNAIAEAKAAAAAAAAPPVAPSTKKRNRDEDNTIDLVNDDDQQQPSKKRAKTAEAAADAVAMVSVNEALVTETKLLGRITELRQVSVTHDSKLAALADSLSQMRAEFDTAAKERTDALRRVALLEAALEEAKVNIQSVAQRCVDTQRHSRAVATAISIEKMRDSASLQLRCKDWEARVKRMMSVETTDPPLLTPSYSSALRASPPSPSLSSSSSSSMDFNSTTTA